MARKCFFVPEIKPGAESIDLPADASHHLEKVTRLRVGDPVEIRDGLGNAWTGEVARLKKGDAAVRLVERLDRSNFESQLKITLVMALVRSDIMDMAIRQATELGAARLLAFRASRSQYGLEGKQAEKKSRRWSKIAREAICQCGRTMTPGILLFENLNALLESLPPVSEDKAGELRIFALEGEHERSLDQLGEFRPTCAGVLAAIGPEGGWEGAEIAGFIGAGFHPVHLGPRILRFETAAVALITSIQLLWGDFGRMGRKEKDQ